MELIKKLLSVFFKLCISFSFIGLVYIVYSLNSRLEAYSLKNDKYSGNIKIEYNSSSNSFVNDKKNNSVEKFINCYETPVAIEQFSDELKNKINEIYSLFSDENHTLSFSYEDLYTGLHVSYNEEEKQFAASAIKAPVIIYLYENIDNEVIDKNDIITYLPHYFVEGSGSIQNSEFGTNYTIQELAQKTIVESDNVAYQMISYNLDFNKIRNFWKTLGSDNFWDGNIWSDINSNDGVIYMKELYKYYLTGTDNSNELINYYYNSVLPLIKSSKNIHIAHKSGWRASVIHDMALVLDDYPYVLSIMTDLGYDNYNDFFDKASRLVEEFHNTYWNNKSNYCYNEAF